MPVANAEFLHARLLNSRLDPLDTGHLAWEEESHEYSAIIAAWINGGYLTGSSRDGPHLRIPSTAPSDEVALRC